MPGKRKRLTRKQERLARAIAVAPNASYTELAERSGYASRVHAWEAAQNPAIDLRVTEIRRAMQERMKERGLGPYGIADKIVEGASARQVKYFAHEGVVKDKRVTIDFEQRGKYLDRALGIWGLRSQDIPAEGGPTVAVLQAIVLRARDNGEKI